MRASSLAFVLLLAVGQCVDAQEESAPPADEETHGAAEPAEGSEGSEEEEYVDRYSVTSSKYVRVNVVFPEHGGAHDSGDMLNLVIGEPTPVVVGFANDADEPFNITSIGMYLHSAYDHSFFIQNFTKREYGHEIGAHEEVSLEYQFACDPSFEPMVYQISGAIEYRSMDDDYDFREFSTEFVNVTIDYLPAPSRLTSTMIVSYGLFFLVVAYFSWQHLNLGALELFESQTGATTSKKKSTQESAESDGLTEEERRARAEASWLPAGASKSSNGTEPKKKKVPGAGVKKKGKKKK